MSALAMKKRKAASSYWRRQDFSDGEALLQYINSEGREDNLEEIRHQGGVSRTDAIHKCKIRRYFTQEREEGWRQEVVGSSEYTLFGQFQRDGKARRSPQAGEFKIATLQQSGGERLDV
ncbi:unnamed protein product [Sphagnum balticum]